MMVPVIAFWAFLFGLISAVVAQHKGQSVCVGFLAGFLLGPIGLAIMACQARLPVCPACGTRVKSAGAYICPACHRDIRNPSHYRHVTSAS